MYRLNLEAPDIEIREIRRVYMGHSDAGVHLASTGRPILSALDLWARGG